MKRNGAYKVVIKPLSKKDGGGYLATVPELPGCMSDRATRAEALVNVETPSSPGSMSPSALAAVSGWLYKSDTR